MSRLASSYAGKRVLVTGHTGFKGGWLAAWLSDLGAEVAGAALAPAPGATLFSALGLEQRLQHHTLDLRDLDRLRRLFRDFRPEIVFHLAAQSLVLRSYEDPVETFSTNVLGSTHLLEAARETDSVRALVFVTTDKCYHNEEIARGYRETDRLGGRDPYSASKACAELVFSSYMQSFGDRLGWLGASARAGNVIGGGDWAENRILPDCIRALAAGEPIVVRNPAATRPWQHVLEPLGAYLILGAGLARGANDHAGAWNIGPDEAANRTVGELVDRVVACWGDGEVERAEVDPAAAHEATLLFLDCAKIRGELGWRPCFDFDGAVATTVDWYRQVDRGAPVWELTLQQIRDYQSRLETSMEHKE